MLDNVAPTQPAADLPPNILILDDEATTVMMLSHVLTGERWEVFGARNIAEADSVLTAVAPHIAIVDVFLGEEDGLSFVRKVRKQSPEMGIVVISAEDTESLAKKALDSGADYFLSKPVPPTGLILTIKRLVELREERIHAQQLREQLDRSFREPAYLGIVSHCDSMKAVLRLVEKVASRDLSVLVCGESGTGKELVARAIHQNSPRKRGNFVELNCAALPANLVESELFGHEKGSFTGAIASRPGKIELAHNGTLFMDEIGELPLEIQPKLLRALQEKKITRVGGKQEIACDFRLLSATHRDLLQEVRNNNFREDLFYRVAVFPIKIPPLRDRMEDLDLLLAHFLAEEGLKRPVITAEARELLASYRWPGNVRELRNFAQAITLLTEKAEIDEAGVRSYFGTRLGEPLSAKTPAPMTPGASYQLSHRPVRKLEDIEREEIFHALRVYKGNVPEAAIALGMGRATLYKFIKKHDINLNEFSG